jgi:Ca2+-binding EF-hand superfamily protein
MEEFQLSFKTNDTDKDGYIDQNELCELMKKYDPDFYVGFASAIIDKIDFMSSQGNKINLDQAKEYFAAFQNKSTYLHDMKYEILREVFSLIYAGG